MNQVQNGKAFEFAKAYYDFLKERSVQVKWVKNDALINTQKCFHLVSQSDQKTFLEVAKQTIPTLLVLEPGLYLPFGSEKLKLSWSQTQQEL